MAAERIVRLFNEGNRLHTELVIVDDSAANMLERMDRQDVKIIHVPDSEWHEKEGEIARLLKSNEICLIVLDGFSLSLSDEIMEVTNGEIIRVTTPEQAPREVVAALEADLRKSEVVEQPEEKDEEEPKTLESEWADALKINYTPPKLPVPPEVPLTQNDSPMGVEDEIKEARSTAERQYNKFNNRRPETQRNEPMPSTWLIWSILVTVFCCFIPGIVAVIFSSQVSSRYYSGDIEGARRASKAAEIWIIVSFVLGVVAATLYLPFMFVG